MLELEVTPKTEYLVFLSRDTSTKSQKGVWHRAQLCVVFVGINETAHRDHGALAAQLSEALAPVIPKFQ